MGEGPSPYKASFEDRNSHFLEMLKHAQQVKDEVREKRGDFSVNLAEVEAKKLSREELVAVLYVFELAGLTPKVGDKAVTVQEFMDMLGKVCEVSKDENQKWLIVVKITTGQHTFIFKGKVGHYYGAYFKALKKRSFLNNKE